MENGFVKLREHLGLTQPQMGIILDVTESRISQIERGVAPPSTKLLRKVYRMYTTQVEELGITPLELLGISPADRRGGYSL